MASDYYWLCQLLADLPAHPGEAAVILERILTPIPPDHPKKIEGVKLLMELQAGGSPTGIKEWMDQLFLPPPQPLHYPMPGLPGRPPRQSS